MGFNTRRRNIVVLCYPRLIPDAEKSSQVHFTPLGLLAISSLLLENGYEVIILDMNIGDTWENKMPDKENIVCVGISAMTGHQIKDGIAFGEKVRLTNPEIQIVWGGIHVTIMPEQSIKSEWVDIIVLGQGEITFLELVQHLSQNLPLDSVRGIIFKRNDQIIFNSPRPFVSPDQFPPAPYELLNMERYFIETNTKTLRSSDAFKEKNKRFLYYCSSLGCPYHCAFCASSKHSAGRWIGLSAGRVIDDIGKLVKKYQIDYLQFCDAEFFIDIERGKKIAQGFIERQLPIKWKAQVRANIFDSFDDEMMNILKKSGYIHVEIGVESGSQKMLDYINKKITTEMVVRCAEKIRRFEMLSSFCFVFGFPHETKEDRQASFRLAAKLKEILPECLLPTYFFDPYPGVPLFYESIKQGLTPADSFEAWGEIKPNMREPSPLVPWTDNKFMDKVHRVMIFWLPLAFPADISLGTLTYIRTRLRKGKWKWVVWLAHKIALWRVKREFYHFSIEWFFFKFFRKILFP